MRQGSEAAAGEAFVGSCRARASGLDDDGEWLMGMLNNGLGLDLDIWAFFGPENSNLCGLQAQ